MTVVTGKEGVCKKARDLPARTPAKPVCHKSARTSTGPACAPLGRQFSHDQPRHVARAGAVSVSISKGSVTRLRSVALRRDDAKGHKPTSLEPAETNTLSVGAHPRDGESVEAEG